MLGNVIDLERGDHLVTLGALVPLGPEDLGPEGPPLGGTVPAAEGIVVAAVFRDHGMGSTAATTGELAAARHDAEMGRTIRHHRLSMNRTLRPTASASNPRATTAITHAAFGQRSCRR